MTQTYMVGGWGCGKTFLSNAMQLIAWLRLGKRTRHFLEAYLGTRSYTDETIKKAKALLAQTGETIETERRASVTYYQIGRT